MKVDQQPKGAWPKIKRFLFFIIGLFLAVNLLGVIVSMLTVMFAGNR